MVERNGNLFHIFNEYIFHVPHEEEDEKYIS